MPKKRQKHVTYKDSNPGKLKPLLIVKNKDSKIKLEEKHSCKSCLINILPLLKCLQTAIGTDHPSCYQAHKNQKAD